jgi:hypothetical protein
MDALAQENANLRAAQAREQRRRLDRDVFTLVPDHAQIDRGMGLWALISSADGFVSSFWSKLFLSGAGQRVDYSRDRDPERCGRIGLPSSSARREDGRAGSAASLPIVVARNG